VSEQPAAKVKTLPGKAANTAGGKKENVFTHKLGPLPMWAWVGIAGAGLVAWRVAAGKKAAASSSNTPASGTAGSGSSGLAGGASPYDIPQFVNQTYTSLTAPSSTTYVHPDDHRGHQHDHPRGPGHDPDDHHHGPPPQQGQPGGHMGHDHPPGQGPDRSGGDPDRNRRGKGGGFGGGGGQQGGGRNGQHWTGQWHHQNSRSGRTHADHASRGGGSGRYGRDR
jgi:hypothetical protein